MYKLYAILFIIILRYYKENKLCLENNLTCDIGFKGNEN